MAEAAPHCCNIRDAQTGETVLHRLAHARQMESLQKWLSVCPDVAPVADEQGLTAVQVAVQLDQIIAAQALWQKMPASITSISASLVMVVWLAPDTRIGGIPAGHRAKNSRTLATFRTELAREARCADSTATLSDGSDEDRRVLSTRVANKVPSIWSDKPLTFATVAWRVVVSRTCWEMLKAARFTRS